MGGGKVVYVAIAVMVVAVAVRVVVEVVSSRMCANTSHEKREVVEEMKVST